MVETFHRQFETEFLCHPSRPLVPGVEKAGKSQTVASHHFIRRIGLRKLYTLASEAPDPGYSMSHAEELTELLAARAVEEFLSDREV